MEKTAMNQAIERLAKLEGQMEIFLRLLEEIREDVKDQLSKEEIDRIENQIKELKNEIAKLELYYDEKLEKVEDRQNKTDIKLAGYIATISIITTIATSLLVKWLTSGAP